VGETEVPDRNPSQCRNADREI